MRAGTVVIASLALLATARVSATPASTGHRVHGLVFDDADGDGKPSAGEDGVADAVVAFGTHVLGTTDATGQFDFQLPDDADSGIFWVRVPDGFRPGPVWARWEAAQDGDIELALTRLPEPIRGPFTFVVAADTHISAAQTYFGGSDLASIATAATSLDPAPAFFTVLGDITQGNKSAEFELVDEAIANLGVPWIPVPGNHDWYDGGETWFRRYGPDNYSFDLGGVHFVVWNMTMSDAEIRAYLGAELARVPRSMPIVALTHAPPNPDAVDVLRELGVAYVLTGHAHSNRVVDHDGLIELGTEPLLMGGLDFTPAGYRVITVTPGDRRLTSIHRTVVDTPFLAMTSPTTDRCTPAHEASLLVAAELDAASSSISARIDCGSPRALAWVGGWTWQATLPDLSRGTHEIAIAAKSASGARATVTTTIEVCDAPPAPALGADWPQLGGGATHGGARPGVLAPPLQTRWTSAVGGHVITASPIVADGRVYVATTDLADGDRGTIVALDLATGATIWIVHTDVPMRGGPAFVPARGGRGGTIVAARIDGAVLAFDAATGRAVWREELSTGLPAEAGAVFGTPASDDGDVLIGHQRKLAVLDGQTGMPEWTIDPVPEGRNSQSLAAVAIGDGAVIGTFNRAFGGVGAWDRATGSRLWRVEGDSIVAINASPVIDERGGSVFVVTGMDEVLALALSDGELRWHHGLDADGFHWGNATIGTPAVARGVVVVPTLYRDLVALDATDGVELWRAAASAPSVLRETHYRGAGQAGFAASPIITGDLVWSVDTAGDLAARELSTGKLSWRTPLGVPVLAGLAASGDWLIVASYDGTVRALVTSSNVSQFPVASDRDNRCEKVPGPAGCCDAHAPSDAHQLGSTALLVLIVAFVWTRRGTTRPARVT